MRLHVGWAINRIPYCSSNGCAWLGVGYSVGRWLEEESKKSLSTIDSCTYMHASRLSTRDINNTCMFGIASKHACKRGVAMINIIHCRFF